MKQPRLLYVLPKPDFFSAGGRGRVTHALGICEGFLENGWDVTVVSGTGASEHWFAPLGLSEVVIPAVADEVTRLGPIGQALWLRRLHRTLVELIELPDRPLVLIRYTFRWLLWIRRMAAVLGRSGIPSVIEVNSFGYHMGSGRLPGVARQMLLKLETGVTARFDFTYVVSPELGRLLRETGYPAPVITVPNGVSSRLVSRSQDRAPAGDASGGPRRFVYFGTFQSYYNFGIVIEAFQRLRAERPGIELHLHGSGPERDRIRELSRHTKDVTLHGRYEIRELLEWLDRDRDILVLPPKKEYDVPLSGGLSTKLFEYMAMGLPVVASEQVSGVLDGGQDALLYAPDRVEDLTDRLRDVLDDPELAQRLGRSVRGSVLAHTWQARCKCLIEMLPYPTASQWKES